MISQGNKIGKVANRTVKPLGEELRKFQKIIFVINDHCSFASEFRILFLSLRCALFKSSSSSTFPELMKKFS